MTADIRRIRAVVASLRGIRDRIEHGGDEAVWDSSAYDRAVGLLNGAIDNADFSGHLLECEELGAADYLVHLDSLIAFLEVYEKDGESSGGILSFPGRKS